MRSVSLEKGLLNGLKVSLYRIQKMVFVAYEGDDLLGAVLYKYYQVGDKKIGYVDYVFVDKKAHGKGVGSRLISACVKQMWEDGCLVYQGWSNNI